MKRIIHFAHALPNAWLPAPDKQLVISGVTADRVAEICKGSEIVSHVRYEDHAARISAELAIDLPASGINAPSPFNVSRGDILVVAALSPGTTTVQYMIVWDGTAAMMEAGL